MEPVSRSFVRSSCTFTSCKIASSLLLSSILPDLLALKGGKSGRGFVSVTPNRLWGHGSYVCHANVGPYVREYLTEYQ